MGVFYMALGAGNIWVALNRSEADWVTFKIWILMPVASCSRSASCSGCCAASVSKENTA